MALNGIINEHEFYSQHYLDEVFPSEIKELTESPKDRQAELPWNRLIRIGREYLRDLGDLSRIRDKNQRLEEENRLRGVLLCALDLPFENPENLVLENGYPLPLAAQINDFRGRPYLWIFSVSDTGGAAETADGEDADEDGGSDPLELTVSSLQTGADQETLPASAREFAGTSWHDILSNGVFNEDLAPRWVILAHAREWLLIDRAKFALRRLLRFDWEEIFSRRETPVLQAVSVLLGGETFRRHESGMLLETLDDSSFRHAQGVSEDLKYALREAIELLGNEAARQLREKAKMAKKSFFGNASMAAEISAACLRYMYRLLFIFYAEARSQLNYVPVNDENYMTGYSLESLRDLEMIPLAQEEDRNSLYIHNSIQKLFDFFSKGSEETALKWMTDQDERALKSFVINPLQSTLFDESRMAVLKDVAFPNHVLQKVIELLSLSRASLGRRQRRGRISYAHLGLNQLGAVYESLLSYRGFFAASDLYELKPAESKEVNPLEAAYFVPAEDLKKYTDEEKVFEKDPVTGKQRLKVYPRGTFIYRMSGRERENSASYYTPEVLTKCVVEEALDVLVKQQLEGLPDDKAKAEKILSWKICEPAMGSASFLNEAINQIAELYMLYAQRVPGAPVLSQVQHGEELQKVKMFLADRNIYGVDLNPVAVELAEVSLWLNALSSDRFVPWFGLQLECGNSLIGCRRQAFYTEDLRRKNWRQAMPHAVGPEGLKEGEIWHFLVPDENMSLYTDKVAGRLEPGALKKLGRWQQEMMKPFADQELAMMEMISIVINHLWDDWAEKLDSLDSQTTDPYSIYGRPEEGKKGLTYEEKQSLRAETEFGGENLLESGEYARLKMAMDYWCALWFWPLDKADILPANRSEWLRQMNAVVSGLVKVETSRLPGQGNLFEIDDDLFDVEERKEQALTNIERRQRAFESRYPALKTAREIAEEMRFLHWELRFATVFMLQNGDAAGFDLILGNPPWKVASWDSAGILGDADPVYVIHKNEYSAKGIQDVVLGKRDTVGGRTFFERNPMARKAWLNAFTQAAGLQNFFNSEKYFPECRGSQSDLFKFFLPAAWRNASKEGVQGFLHPETVYTETKGIALRKEAYSRVRKHYQFANERKLFADVHNETEFSVNVYGRKEENPQFESINNLYSPKTIKVSRHPNDKVVQGRKDENGKWNVSGHPDRILAVDKAALDTIGQIFNTGSVPLLPNIHAREMLDILVKLGNVQNRLRDVNPDITPMWHETGAKQDGTMREMAGQETVFPERVEDAIINGPVVHVGSPLFKCPDNPCPNNKSWTCIDLTVIPDDYLPRVKYLPAVDSEEYLRRMQKVTRAERDLNGVLKEKQIGVASFYRLALREMVGTESERTLTSGIIPPGMAHPHKIESIVFGEVRTLLVAAAFFASLAMDFFVRQQGKGDLLPELLRNLPLPEVNALQYRALAVRVLALNCLTSYYADLWKTAFDEQFRNERWASRDSLLDQSFFAELPDAWERRCALRDDLSRRQALIEIDVIAAQAFGLTLEELSTCSRLGFRVMQGYELDTWYDQSGRIVFTPNSNGLKGVGLPRKPKKDEDAVYAVNGKPVKQGISVGFEDVKEMKSGTVSKTFTDTTLKGNPRRTIIWTAPFFKKDREADYAEAWHYFKNLGKNQRN